MVGEFAWGGNEKAPLLKARLSGIAKLSGDEGDRTPDPDTASVVLSQLSYIPN